jgi:hypothetical protein
MLTKQMMKRKRTTMALNRKMKASLNLPDIGQRTKDRLPMRISSDSSSPGAEGTQSWVIPVWSS